MSMWFLEENRKRAKSSSFIDGSEEMMPKSEKLRKLYKYSMVCTHTHTETHIHQGKYQMNWMKVINSNAHHMAMN